MTLSFRRRMLRLAGIAVGLPVIAMAALIAIQQHILRWRAERLLADVRELQFHKSTWDDAQTLRARWKEESDDDGPCSKAQCRFFVTVEDPTDPFYRKIGDGNPIGNFLEGIYLLAGRKFVRADASITIRNGVVSQSRYELWVEVPGPRFWNFEGSYALVGIAEQKVGGFAPYEAAWSRVLHPEYFIGKPGGCEGCVKILTQYTPATDQSKVREFTDFNFGCITRLSRCRTEADLMPWAGQQFEQESLTSSARMEAFGTCKLPLEFMGRESEGVAIADVISRQARHRPKSLSLAMRIRLVRFLKGKSVWPTGMILQTVVENGDPEVQGRSSTDIVAGRRYLLLGHFGEDQRGEKGVALDDCGVIPCSEQNLEAIQKGIDEWAANEAQLEKH